MGSLTGSTPRKLAIPLDFLGRGTFHAEIYEDDLAARTGSLRLQTRKESVTSAEVLTAQMSAAGGQAIRFSPIASGDGR